MRILHARDYSVQPWKNGGGVTTQIAVWPMGAAIDTFDWRISMARVEAAGPFSRFAGIDRSLGLLAGGSLVLRIDTRGEVALRPGDHPAVFPGDVAVDALLPAGPILDLNVMTRRGRWRHQLSRSTARPGKFEVRANADVTIAVVAEGHGTIGDEVVAQGDALHFEAPSTATLTLDGSATIWIAELWRHQV